MKNYARRGMGCASIYPRAKNDLYTTSPIAITLLDKNGFLNHDVKYWECACGTGNLSEELKRLGYSVFSSDLYNYNYGTAGIDFLKCSSKFEGDIITNPPFSLLNEFILKGLQLTDGKLYIFSRLQTLESYKRYNFIFKNNAPAFVLPFVRRVKCFKEGDAGRGSSVTPYAWFIWDNANKNHDTIIKWLI